MTVVPGSSSSAVGKQAAVGKVTAEAEYPRDHHQPRDVAPVFAGLSAFAASAGSFPEVGTSAGADAGIRPPRGVEAMMGGQRRTHSGALTSPSGLSDHGSLLVERAASCSSAHRALLGGCSPGRTSPTEPAAATALLELSERSPTAHSSGHMAAAASDDVVMTEAGQQQQQADLAAEAAAAAGMGGSRRPAGMQRPTVLIPPSPPAAFYSPVAQPMASPASALAHPYSGGVYSIDELPLDVIDDIPGVDACGLSTSSSPTISGVNNSRGIAGSHLRSSRDQDLRRHALLNMQLLSPGIQAGGAHITAASNAGGGALSITAEGPVPGLLPGMFTGSTRARALPGSNSSLQSAGNANDHYTSTDSPEALQMVQALRLSRGSTPSPAPNGSPARPRSATTAATPRAAVGGASGGSSAAGSPVPPASHGPAAALLAGSVLPSPRTPHSPLSVALSPSLHSARVLSGQGTPLPGPLFGGGFGLVAPGTAASPGTSPGTSTVAAPSSTTSSCCTGSGTGIAPAAGRSSTQQAPGGVARRFTSSSPTPGATAGSDMQQQQGEAAQMPPPTQMQQLLRQQVMQHDTRFGPHGGSPLSPSHHQAVLPPRADALLSPTCPTPLVPPALMAAGSRNGQLADATAAAAAVAPSGAAPAGRSAGDVGHLSIHEWLDHQSWRLPYEVPQGLRDAADVREAAAHEQQHAQSRMGPSNRGSISQRSSVSNLDSSGVLLGAGSGGFAGRVAAAAAAGGGAAPGNLVHAAAAEPPTAQQLLQQRLHQQQQHQPGTFRHAAEALQRRHVLPQHASVEQDSRMDRSPDQAEMPWQGHVSNSYSCELHSQLAPGSLSVELSGPPMLPSSINSHFAGAQLSPGDWAQHQVLLRQHGQQEQQQQQCTRGRQQWHPVAAGPLPSVLEGSHASSTHHRRSQSHLSSCSNGDASDTDAVPSRIDQRCAAAPAAASNATAVQPACSFAAMDAAAGSDTRDAAAAGGLAVGSQLADHGHAGAALTGLQMHTGRDAARSSISNSNSGPSVMQLGVGSHLYPAGSPEPGCCTCQQSPGQTLGPASCSTNSISSSSPGGSPGAVSAPAGSGQQHLVAPLTWQQLQRPVGLPIIQGQQGHDAGVPGVQGSHRRHSQAQQNTLPGIAELLRLRHEPPLLQGQERSSTIPSGGQSHRAARPGLPAAVSPGYDVSPASSRHPSTCRNPGGTPGDGSCPLSTMRRATAATVATAGLGGSRAATGLCADNISSRDTVLAALLMDNGFMARVLASLPGVDPASDLVQMTVAELQQALCGLTSTAPQHNTQLP